MSTASEKASDLAAVVRRLETDLEDARAEARRLDRQLNEACDDVFMLRQQARSAGLSEQSQRALEMAQRYVDEGDDPYKSQRVFDCLIQAMASCKAAKEAA